MAAYLLVLSTASSKKEAVKISKILLDKRLAACVNIVPGVESHYRWQGKKQKEKEVLMLIKTRAPLYKKLEKALQTYHSYNVPEILAVPILKGSKPYLSWIDASTVA